MSTPMHQYESFAACIRGIYTGINPDALSHQLYTLCHTLQVQREYPTDVLLETLESVLAGAEYDLDGYAKGITSYQSDCILRLVETLIAFGGRFELPPVPNVPPKPLSTTHRRIPYDNLENRVVSRRIRLTRLGNPQPQLSIPTRTALPHIGGTHA